MKFGRDSRGLDTDKVSSNSIDDRLEHGNVRKLDDYIIKNLATHARYDHSGKYRGPTIVEDITSINIIFSSLKAKWCHDYIPQ